MPTRPTAHLAIFARNADQRRDRQIQAVACRQVGVAFGPVQCISAPPKGSLPAPKFKGADAAYRPTEAISLGDKSIPVRWEMTANREALVSTRC